MTKHYKNLIFHQSALRLLEWLGLNIIGTEWIIVVFVALILILGTGKLPAAARKMGKAAAEFEKAKNDIKQQMYPEHNIRVSGPVQNERQKLEAMASSVGIDPSDMSTEELRRAIQDKIDGSSSKPRK